MKKALFFIALAFSIWACSSDDGGEPVVPDTYSAHVKTECGEGADPEVFDFCISKETYDYLLAYRESTTNPCLGVEFVDLDGIERRYWLIRVELNKDFCAASGE